MIKIDKMYESIVGDTVVLARYENAGLTGIILGFLS